MEQKRRKKKRKQYRKGQILIVDFGARPQGVEGFLRPAIVVSCDASNHPGGPQITVCPLSSRLKPKIKVHVAIEPDCVIGKPLRRKSEVLPEDIQTVSKKAVKGYIGYIPNDSELMARIDDAISQQLALH